MSRRSAGSKRSCQRGISLIETLIALALGLLVLTAVIQLMNQLVDGNTATIRTVRLAQDTRTVMDMIVQDLRRAGQFSESARDLGDPGRFLQDQPAAPLIDGSPLQNGKMGGSIAYAYREPDGKLTQASFFRDVKTGTVQMHTGTASAPETITDSSFMTVSDLSFVPTIQIHKAGSREIEIVLIEVRISARLKSDPAVERQLVDRVVLRNGVLR